MSTIYGAKKHETEDCDFAFVKGPKLLLNDAAHVRNAIARFKEVKDVTDTERDLAWQRIITAAKKHQVEPPPDDWRQLP